MTADPRSPLARAARGIRADAIVVVDAAQSAAFAAAGFDLFAEKTMQDGRPTAYDCRDFACRLPVTDVAQLTP